MKPSHFSFFSFVSGFMVGAVAVGAILFSASEPTLPFSLASKETRPSETRSRTTSEEWESGAVVVGNQAAGTSVTIESVTVPPPGVWVAVREMEGEGLGNVLGAVRVQGPRTNVLVPLLRATEPSREYAVQLYRDDGNGQFDIHGDSAYVDFTTGVAVKARFTTN